MNYIAKRSSYLHTSPQNGLVMDGAWSRDIHLASRRRDHGVGKYDFLFQENPAKEVKVDSVVYIVDGDSEVRGGLQRLMKFMNLHSEVFEAPGKFLEAPQPDIPSCLVLDVRLPGLSGLDLQRQLANEGNQLPTIFVTG